MSICETDVNEVPLSYWSDKHYWLLLRAAKDALRVFPSKNVPIHELVSVGWMQCLRRRREDQLRGCYNITYWTMLSFLSFEVKQKQKCLCGKKDASINLYNSDSMLDSEQYLSVINSEYKDLLIRRYIIGNSLSELKDYYGTSRQAIQQKCDRALSAIRKHFKIEVGG